MLRDLWTKRLDRTSSEIILKWDAIVYTRIFGKKDFGGNWLSNAQRHVFASEIYLFLGFYLSLNKVFNSGKILGCVAEDVKYSYGRIVVNKIISCTLYIWYLVRWRRCFVDTNANRLNFYSQEPGSDYHKHIKIQIIFIAIEFFNSSMMMMMRRTPSFSFKFFEMVSVEKHRLLHWWVFRCYCFYDLGQKWFISTRLRNTC